jgi:hypothetical protein
MNYEEAVNLILMQGAGRDDVRREQVFLQDGFLGCLRPFSGLREENFIELMRAIIALKPHLSGAAAWELRLVQGLWELTTRARHWGLDQNGMLQRNQLLSDAESRRLLLWVQCIEMAVSRLMNDGDPADAMDFYRSEERAE